MNSAELENPKNQHEHEKDEDDNVASTHMATDILQSLSKAIKTLKIYPKTSPLRQKFFKEVSEKFSIFLDEFGDMILQVKQTEFLYHGEVVYSHASKDDNIAFKLYNDGIRELIFIEDLEESEIFDFISVITMDSNMIEYDDIVTLLWEKNFKNIRYIVAEEDGDSSKPSEDRDKQTSPERSRTTLLNAHRAETDSETQGKTVLEPANVEIEIENIYGKPFSEIFNLTAEEIEKVQQEMEQEEGMDFIHELLDILFHILQIEKEIESYTEIVTSIEKAIKSLVLSGDYKRVIPILTTLKTLSKDENNFSSAHAEAIEKTVDALGNEDFLKQLALSINVNKIEDIDTLISFLSMLNENAIEPLAEMVGVLDDRKTRRLFCDVLVHLAKDKTELLLNKLDDKNWYLVRNIVYILGKIRDPRVLPNLRRLKDHSEPRIRKEIIHTLSEIRNDEAKDLMIYFLKDDNSSVRTMALKNLSALGHRKAVPTILSSISDESFNNRDLIEKMEHFEALGLLGSNDLLPKLKEILMRRSWFFGKSKMDEQRILVTHTLRKMDTPEAIRILQEGILSSDKGTRRICEDALKEMGKEKRT